MTRFRHVLGAVAALAGVAGAVGPAEAGVIYGFKTITNNIAGDAAIGEAQLKVEVIDAGAGKVAFKFTNSGPAASSITDLYWDDGTLLGIASITDSGPGVDFSPGANPGSLPSGNTIDFNNSGAFFSADSNNPTQPKGVNPGEWVTVTFNLINGKTYQDTLNAIALSLANPGVDMLNGLRIGIHVQGFATDGSESFVNGPPIGPPPVAVPAPAGVVLLAAGALTLGLGRLRRRAAA